MFFVTRYIPNSVRCEVESTKYCNGLLVVHETFFEKRIVESHRWFFFCIIENDGVGSDVCFSSRAGHFLTTARSLTTGISSVMACRVLNSFRNFDFLESISSSCESSRSACNSFSRISFAK